MANINEQKYSFKRFQNILLNAASLENACPDNSAQTDVSAPHSLLPEKTQVYTNILLLIALKCLQSYKQNSFHKNEAVLSKKRDVLELRSSDILMTSVDLYWQVRDFWLDKLSEFIPPPTEMRQETIDALRDLNYPELTTLWSDPCAIGYAYQFLASPARKTTQVEIQSSNKQLPLHKLITFTQIYTPDWVVDFLLINCLVAQWKGIESKRFPLLLKAKNQEPVSTRSVEELTVLDPACGSGHFLVRAVNRLLGLYEFEPIDRVDALRHIISNCIAGVDIDVFGLWVAAVTLLVRCLMETTKVDFRINNLTHALPSEPNADRGSLLGSLSRKWPVSHPLNRHFTAVVTNPPYIGRKLMSRELKAELAQEYPDCHHDLCAPFVERGLELLAPGGRLGLITQASLLSLPSYTTLRRQILDKHCLRSAIEVGTGVFPLQGGEKVNSVLLVIQKSDLHKPVSANGNRTNQTIFANIAQSPNKVQALSAIVLDANTGTDKNCFRHNPSIFLKSDRCAFTYSCPSEILQLLSHVPKLSDIAEVRQGLATSDNDRFVRDWWQVEPADLHNGWVPYVKGAGGNRWYSPIKHVINWHNNGAEIKKAVSAAYPYLKGNISWVVKNEQFYFRPGLCFSFVSSRDLAVRQMPKGCIFDVGASALFTDKDKEDFLLGYLNSSFINAVAKLLNPTVNFQVGDIKKLPLLSFSHQDRDFLASLSRDCVELKHSLAECLDAGLNWKIPGEVFPIFHGEDPIMQSNRFCKRIESISEQLTEREHSINQIVLSNLEKNIDIERSVNGARIKNWITGASESKVALMAESCRNVFANNLLRYCIRQRLSMHDGEGRGILIVPADPAHLTYAMLGLPGDKWWEKLMRMPLKSYLKELTIKTKVSSILPYLCLHLPISQCFLFGRSQDLLNGALKEIAWVLNRATWTTVIHTISPSSSGYDNEVLVQAEKEAQTVLAKLFPDPTRIGSCC